MGQWIFFLSWWWIHILNRDATCTECRPIAGTSLNFNGPVTEWTTIDCVAVAAAELGLMMMMMVMAGPHQLPGIDRSPPAAVQGRGAPGPARSCKANRRYRPVPGPAALHPSSGTHRGPSRRDRFFNQCLGRPVARRCIFFDRRCFVIRRMHACVHACLHRTNVICSRSASHPSFLYSALYVGDNLCSPCVIVNGVPNGIYRHLYPKNYQNWT